MGYKGIPMTNQEDYLFSETIPDNPEFDLEELKRIQRKIEDYTSEISEDGITTKEAEVFLDWVTFNARSYATKDIPESAVSSPMTGMCAPTQRINCKLLCKMGLDVRAFNTSNCIGEIPMTQEDINREKNIGESPAIRHSVSLVNLPIINSKGETKLYGFLLDPTFRQFCLKSNCNYDKFLDENEISRGCVAPHPGYFMKANNLINLGVDSKTSQKTELLCRQIISKGYFYLNEENAKLYGDSFVRASTRLEFQGRPINMTGRDYIENFENTPMETLKANEEEKYTITPTSMEKKKEGILSRMINWIKNRFRTDEPLMLEEGNNAQKSKSTSSIKGLTTEELSEFKDKEKNILASYDINTKQENIQGRMDIER